MQIIQRARVASSAAIMAVMTTSACVERIPARPIGLVTQQGRQCIKIDRDPASDYSDVFECNIAREDGDRRLRTIAISAGADPIKEAKQAADAQDFRFIGYSMLVPGTYPAAYGISCIPSVVSQGMRMVRDIYYVNDVPPPTAKEVSEREHEQEMHRDFGERYNAALIADRRSPYRRLCKSVPRGAERAPFTP